MNTHTRSYSAAAILVLCACAGTGGSGAVALRTGQAAGPQPILVLNGEVRPCGNSPGTPPNLCAAAASVPAGSVVRAYNVPADSARAYYGERGAAGAHVVVTNALDTSSPQQGKPTFVMVVGGARHVCPLTADTQRDPTSGRCTPPVRAQQWVLSAQMETVRAPRSIELFGRSAGGGAIVLRLQRPTPNT
jgi:hypothetical protein